VRTTAIDQFSTASGSNFLVGELVAEPAGGVTLLAGLWDVSFDPARVCEWERAVGTVAVPTEGGCEASSGMGDAASTGTAAGVRADGGISAA